MPQHVTGYFCPACNHDAVGIEWRSASSRLLGWLLRVDASGIDRIKCERCGLEVPLNGWKICCAPSSLGGEIAQLLRLNDRRLARLDAAVGRIESRVEACSRSLRWLDAQSELVRRQWETRAPLGVHEGIGSRGG